MSYYSLLLHDMLAQDAARTRMSYNSVVIRWAQQRGCYVASLRVLGTDTIISVRHRGPRRMRTATLAPPNHVGNGSGRNVA